MPPGGWAPAHFIRESDARPVHRRTAGAGSWAQVNPDHQAGSLLRSRDKAEASSQSGNIRSQMSKDRLEAFSDGMIAIIITIMVLELRPPSEATWTALLPLIPVFLSNVLSLVFLGIYWNNHHHLLQAVERVDGRVLWANMHLLFWLSMVPFVTAWMGENRFAAQSVALYVVVMLFAALAYYLLARSPHAPWAGVALGDGARERCQRQSLAIAALPGRYSVGVCRRVDGVWPLCPCSLDMVPGRPAH